MKEYALGVDVFDRPESFDPRTDSIVRVNVNRLRHKLREYYETEGAEAKVRIQIPKGSYTATLTSLTAAAEPEPRVAAPEAEAQVQAPGFNRRTVLAASVSAAVAGAAAWQYAKYNTETGIQIRRLTHLRGRISGAKFASGGTEVVFSSSSGTSPASMWSQALRGGDPKRLPHPNARIMRVTAAQRALIVQPEALAETGRLSFVSLNGNQPPAALGEGVLNADCDLSGSVLAMTTRRATVESVEFPISKKIADYQSSTEVRVSADGKRCAIFSIVAPGKQTLFLATPGQQPVEQFSGPPFATMPIWTGKRGSMIFGASHGDAGFGLYRFDPGRGYHLVSNTPDLARPWDVGPSGEILASMERLSFSVNWIGPSASRKISFRGNTFVESLSADGRKILTVEIAHGPQGKQGLCLFEWNQDRPVELVSGKTGAISPDGSLVVSIDESGMFLTQANGGSRRNLNIAGLSCRYAAFTVDSKRILFSASEPSREPATYMLDLTAGGPPRRVTPYGFTGRFASPDGKWLVTGRAGAYYLVALDPNWDTIAEPKLFRPPTNDRLLSWHPDSRRIICSSFENRNVISVYLFDVFSGRLTQWRRYTPSEEAAELVNIMAITPDGTFAASTQLVQDSTLVQLDLA